MTPGYRVRQSAEADLEKIWLHTFQEWGDEQADIYTRSLLARFAWLAENPRAGKPRGDVKPGYYSFPEGMHVVFYTISEEGLDIIGIPHQSMDVISYLDR